MTAITLHRSDPAKNMRRFYRLDVQRDLFGQIPTKLINSIETKTLSQLFPPSGAAPGAGK